MKDLVMSLAFDVLVLVKPGIDSLVKTLVNTRPDI